MSMKDTVRRGLSMKCWPNFMLLVLVLCSSMVYGQDEAPALSDQLESSIPVEEDVQPQELTEPEEVVQICHSAFAKYFVEEGVFEGRNIHRMRQPIHSGSR